MTSLELLNLSSNPLIAPPVDLIDRGVQKLFIYFRLLLKAARFAKLSLAAYGLTHFPPDACVLQHITELTVSGNMLSELCPQFVNMTSLTSLNLSNNRFVVLPAVACGLTNLRSIDIRMNPLVALTIEAGKLHGYIEEIKLDGITTLQQPPPGVVQRGTATITDRPKSAPSA